MTDHTFISSPVSVLTGDAARVALETINDAAYYIEGKGVLSVPYERWHTAQMYERATWLDYGLTMTEDRNTEHAAMFDGYKALPHYLGKTIELGCGPFSNIRHISNLLHPTSHVTLVDPLIDEYRAHHPNCPYNHWRLMAGDDAYSFIASPIESLSIDGLFDTVVMINVLPHCQSVDTVFSWINVHLKSGGYLVFHEPARDIDPSRLFDVGHPLSYTQAVIDEFLSGYTETYRRGDYFIGVKK